MKTRNDRRILLGATAFFVAFALLFICLALWRAYDLQQSIKVHFRDQAKVVATQNAVTLAATINSHFHDLEFIKNAFFAQGTNRLLPSAQFRAAFTAFQRTHPSIAAINIQDPSGNRIVWSSRKQARPITYGKNFSPLPGYPDRLLGRFSYAKRDHAWILTMRYRIRDNEGHVLGFIGSPFILANLDTIHTPSEFQSMVATDSQGQVISVWKNGQWMPPNTPLPPYAGKVVVPVPGYPWHLQVQWTAATLHNAFWHVQRTRLPVFLSIMFFIAGMGLWVRWLLLNLLRLRQYQSAAILAQQDLLHQNDSQAMYQQLAKIVVEQTEAIGACIVVPEVDSEWLRIVAVSADTTELQQALEQLTPSKDPTHFPYGNVAASLAFREKAPQGPIRSHQSPAMAALQQQHHPLERVQSVMAYPVFVGNEPEPAAVLVIMSDNLNHFTLPLQSLFAQLTTTLSLALTQLQDRQEIQELLHREQDTNAFNTALLNSLTVGAIVVRFPERVIEQVNETLLELYGASSRQQLVGHQVLEFYPDKDIYQKVGAFAESVLQNGHGILRDVPYCRLDGTTIYMDLSGVRFEEADKKPRIVWTFVDVTERHTQAETIRKLYQANETLLANTVAGIALVRYPERLIQEANQSFIALFGYDSREEVIGKATSFFYFDPTEEQRMFDTASQILDTGQGGLRDLHILQKDGQDLYLDVSGQRMEGEDLNHPVIVWTAIDVTERHRLTQELSELALFDSLTKLPNRRFLEIQMERDISRASRNEKLFAVCMLDLDGFKPINDTYGHDAGDEVLVAVAKRLLGAIRKSDFVTRWGGDEFVLLIEDLSNMEDLAVVLSKVDEAIRAPLTLMSGESVQVGVSIGVAIHSFKEVKTPDHLLRMADQALYESKAHKGDRERSWVLF